MDTKKNQYDVIVIGGGPAGMMAAGRAAECGASVLLLEKNLSLGKKLLITGGGRCNMTNASVDFFGRFKEDKKFLFSPFSRFGVEETLRFFRERGIATKTEAEGRVFPFDNKAETVWAALGRYMEEGKVRIRFGIVAKGFERKEGSIIGIRVSGNEVLTARSYILATGGTSHPETGSTGDGFQFLKQMNHTVRQSEPSLVPIKIRDTWVRDLSGLSFDDAKLSVFQNGKKHFTRKGKILFTHFGLSGPAVLNMSRDVKELAKYGEVEIAFDFAPGVDAGALDKKIQQTFLEHQKKILKNALGDFLRPSVALVILRLSGIDPEKLVNTVSREERLAIGRLMHRLPMTVSGFLGVDKAIVTSGGVKLSEIDCKTMQSRLYSNLYIIGDMLDIDRPSGGYSLQLCWTTGYVAGEEAAKKE